MTVPPPSTGGVGDGGEARREGDGDEEGVGGHALVVSGFDLGAALASMDVGEVKEQLRFLHDLVSVERERRGKGGEVGAGAVVGGDWGHERDGKCALPLFSFLGCRFPWSGGKDGERERVEGKYSVNIFCINVSSPAARMRSASLSRSFEEVHFLLVFNLDTNLSSHE